MPRSTPAPVHGEQIARDVRPLPVRPSLEYERKAAKAFLKQIRRGETDALRRVVSSHPVSLRGRSPSELKLADAQRVIAREYGFASWPRLVEYFEELERHRHSSRYHGGDEEPGTLEWRAQSIMRRHSRGDPLVARELAHYVPRFYARPLAEILATPILEADARLVVARQGRRGSWEELIERASASRERREEQTWDSPNTPSRRAGDAMRDHDADALEEILDEHPDLLTPSVVEREWRVTPAALAIGFELEDRTPAARRVTDLLESRGVDIQGELDERLLAWPHPRSPVDVLRWYLERGANPHWMPPNGITVLEHALVRYHSGECVDLIASLVTPRRALWIAAGLGDAAAVRSYIAGNGRLKPQGRLNRPDLVAMNARFGAFPPRHDADDLEIMWEAFYVAAANGRWDAMDALLEAGLPVDYAPLGGPLVMLAVGNLRIPLLEYLVSRGSDLEGVWSQTQNRSVRSFARSLVKNLADPHHEDVRRMLEISEAGTLEEILAEMDADRPSPPPPDERTTRVMQLAADDASRRGQAAVTTENMLVGLLRAENGIFAEFFFGTGTDMPKLRERLGDRLSPDADPLAGEHLPAAADAALALQVAAAEADSRRRKRVEVLCLLYGILSHDSGPADLLLRDLGTNKAGFLERLRRAI